MKKLISILLIVMLGASFTYAQDDKNQVDAQGKRQGLWEERTGNKTMKGYYKDGEKVGTWAELQNSGKIGQIESYVDGKKYGLFLEFDRNGTLVEQSFYKEDLLDGISTKYQGSRIASETPYKAGKVDGMKKLFYNNGKKQEESMMKNDVREGVTKWYDQQENMVAEYNYINGEFDGVQKTFHVSGTVRSEETYVKGVATGTYTEYFEDGKVKKQGSYNKAGERNGDWIEYNNAGKKVKTEKYKNGELQ
ncbi:MAG: toxin-antitoxin system YwqK family antitoxin [Bacteroidales bacterium]|nr:toxin-antitoxin system YwqK family antitoxin [Bacteroidales bacterium]